MSFESLGLSDTILRAVKKSGYTIPTPIQTKAIPVILNGNDMMAAAQTGTGKTAGFTLPLLELLNNDQKPKLKSTRALVLTPTRELAAQVEESVIKYGKYLNLKTAVIYGGVNMHRQITRLKQGVDIIVATPGRLLDLHRQKAIHFDDIEMLVLDEADRMLDMGFLPDIKTVLNAIPNQHQTLMFSATFSKAIRQLAKGIMENPIEIDISARNTTVKNIRQLVYPIDKARKTELLKHLLNEHNWFQVLVFSRTRHGADKLSKKLIQANIAAAAIHGDKNQRHRTRVLNDFKKNKTRVLVATDIAARGIDVNNLSHVINFDLPQVAEDYIHRIGRTGRAGANGEAISLVSADEANLLFAIEDLIKQKINREEVEGFEVVHTVPDVKKRTRNTKGKGHSGKQVKAGQRKTHGRRSNSKNSQSRSENAKRSRKSKSSAINRQQARVAV